MARLQILNLIEIEAFETPPCFNAVQRKRHFDFPAAILKLAASLRSPTNKVCFLVSWGYFRATRRFYSPDQFRNQDLAFVSAILNFTVAEITINHYSKVSRLRHHGLIREYFGFRCFDGKHPANSWIPPLTFMR